MLAILCTLTTAVLAGPHAPEHARWSISRTVQVAGEGKRLELKLHYTSGALFAEGEFADKGPPFPRPKGKGRILYPDGRVLAESSTPRHPDLGWDGATDYYFADGELFAKVRVNGKGRRVTTLGPTVHSTLDAAPQAAFIRTCPQGTFLRATGPSWGALSSRGKLFEALIEPLTLSCVNASGPTTDSPRVSFHPNGRIRSTVNRGVRTLWYRSGVKAAEARDGEVRCFSEAGTPETSCSLDSLERDRLSHFAFES